MCQRANDRTLEQKRRLAHLVIDAIAVSTPMVHKKDEISLRLVTAAIIAAMQIFCLTARHQFRTESVKLGAVLLGASRQSYKSKFYHQQIIHQNSKRPGEFCADSYDRELFGVEPQTNFKLMRNHGFRRICQNRRNQKLEHGLQASKMDRALSLRRRLNTESL